MARIQRYNVVLDVDDSEVGYYTSLGYNVIDMKGNIIQKAKSNDVHTLQQELDDASKKIADYEKQVAMLNNEITRLNTVIVNMEKSAEENKEMQKVEQPVKTTRRKKGVE